jgi:hypothetical protein
MNPKDEKPAVKTAAPGAPWDKRDGAGTPSEVLSRDVLRETEAQMGRRMDTLERENAQLQQRLRWGMMALGGLFLITVILAVLAAPRAPGVVASLQSREFELLDETGLVRGLWDLDPQGGPRMILRDSDGRDRVRLFLLPDGSPGVTLGDREGRQRVVLAILPDGTSNLVFADAVGHARAVLGHSSSEETTLVLADRDGYTRAGLIVSDKGVPDLMLYSDNDEPGAADPNADPVTPPASTP